MNDIDYYLVLPWTILSTTRRDDGEYIVLQIAELPGFVVAGTDPAELANEYWATLRLFLQTYLDAGEEPPVPAIARIARAAEAATADRVAEAATEPKARTAPAAPWSKPADEPAFA